MPSDRPNIYGITRPEGKAEEDWPTEEELDVLGATYMSMNVAIALYVTTQFEIEAAVAKRKRTAKRAKAAQKGPETGVKNAV